MSFKITAISDTHSIISLPELLKNDSADVLIHCGDFTSGRVDRFGNRASVQYTHRLTFDNFVNELCQIRNQYGRVLIVPGNHDQIVEVNGPYCQEAFNGIEVDLLISKSVTIDEIKFWGHPWTREFGNWFFNGNIHIQHLTCDMIDVDTNILISHGPPAGICDDALGCKFLRNRLFHLKNLTHAFFGHIHEAGGEMMQYGNDLDDRIGMDAYNVSVLGVGHTLRDNPVLTLNI